MNIMKLDYGLGGVEWPKWHCGLFGSYVMPHTFELGSPIFLNVV